MASGGGGVKTPALGYRPRAVLTRGPAGAKLSAMRCFTRATALAASAASLFCLMGCAAAACGPAVAGMPLLLGVDSQPVEDGRLKEKDRYARVSPKSGAGRPRVVGKAPKRKAGAPKAGQS
jgi:hypothetical protein